MHFGNLKLNEKHVSDGKFNSYGLEIITEVIDGTFDCSNLGLTSLEGSPKIIGGYFECNDNKLTSLKGGPVNVGKSFICTNNKLTSLEFGPKIIERSIYTDHNLVDLNVEEDFLLLNLYKKDYHKELFEYMLSNKISLDQVVWPKGFLNNNLKKSYKKSIKFNL